MLKMGHKNKEITLFSVIYIFFMYLVALF